MPRSIDDAQRVAIVDAMNATKGNLTKAAKILQISRDGLRGKIKRLKLRLRPYFKDEA